MAPDKNKENLMKLLDFLNQQILHKPENAWFVESLYSILPKKKDASIGRIEKYLSIDYDIDLTNPFIDFSFVKDDYVRNCFIADFREMLRYRFGTRSHKIDFYEFCRFALMIAERLLNWYYLQDGDIEKIKSHIKLYNKNVNFSQELKSIEAINFSVKLWSYTEQYQLKNVKQILDNVREVRNYQSHGTIQNSNDVIFFEEKRAKLVADKYPLKEDGTVNYYKLREDNVILFNIFVSKEQFSSDYKRYKYLAWLNNKHFKQIFDCLYILAEHVAGNLSVNN